MELLNPLKHIIAPKQEQKETEQNRKIYLISI